MKRSLKKIAAFLLLTTVFLAACDTTSNTPNPTKNYFVKYYGENGFQTGVDVAVNKDGTFILFGNSGVTESLTDTRLFLVKADSYGNIIWKTTFGGLEGNLARDVEITSEGDVVILANSVVSSISEVMVQRFDNASGAAKGAAVILPIANCAGQNKTVYSITELVSSDFIIAGYSLDVSNPKTPAHTQDALQIKITKDFQVYSSAWAQTSGQGTINVASKVIENGNRLFLCGYSNRAANHLTPELVYTLGRMDSAGGEVTPQSTNTLMGISGSNEVLGAAVSDGTYIYFAGISDQSDIYVSKLFVDLTSKVPLDSASIIFTTKVGVNIPFTNPNTTQTSMALSASGGFFVLTNDAASGSSDWLLAKVNGATGLLMTDWAITTYGGAGEDISGAVKELPDGKIIMIGTISIDGETKMALMKVNKIGHFAD